MASSAVFLDPKKSARYDLATRSHSSRAGNHDNGRSSRYIRQSRREAYRPDETGIRTMAPPTSSPGRLISQLQSDTADDILTRYEKLYPFAARYRRHYRTRQVIRAGAGGSRVV